MRAAALVPVLLLAAGVGLVAVALAEGGASLALVLVVPVVVGRSLEFALGVLLLIAGLLTLPLAFPPPATSDEVGAGSPPGGASSDVGGLVLIGPVPIFFGRYRSLPTRTRVLVAILGALALVAAAVALALAAA